jgi:hypothetical protein
VFFFTAKNEESSTNEGRGNKKAMSHRGTPLPKIGESLRGESGTTFA